MKYRVEFTEIIRYCVEFETDVQLNVDADEEDDRWFEAMDAARPNWFKECCDITERDLEDLEQLDDDHELEL